MHANIVRINMYISCIIISLLVHIYSTKYNWDIIDILVKNG